MKSFNISIEHSCPQCGAPALLEETDRLISCPYCRVSSFLMEDICFRYILLHNKPNTNPFIYFPYWRFKGTLSSCYLNKTDYRFIDISLQGIKSPAFPISLGFRSQTLKLKFALPEHEAIFIKPELSVDDISHIAEKRFYPKGANKPAIQSFIGETTSIIYSPYYLKDNMLFDGILNKPISKTLPRNFDIDLLATEKPDWTIDFVPAICPECGWNLSGEKDSLVLLCKNCNSAWQASRKKLEKTNFGCFSYAKDDLFFLPFWQIRANLSEIDLDSYADLVKTANLPKAIQKSWEKLAFKFWIPAFKLRAKHFIRLATQFTLVQPFDKIIKKVPDATMHPVTLPVTEAIESIKTVLSNFVKPKKEYFPLLPDIKITPESYSLLYIPFKKSCFDFIQPKYNISLNESILKTSGNL
ncbi:MAG: hypothetical protein ABIK92_11500 [Pseudomonadota bacterium]